MAARLPTARVVDAIVHRMEDKSRKEANLTGVGGELPGAQAPAGPAVAAAGRDRPSAAPMAVRRRAIAAVATRRRADRGGGHAAKMRPGSGRATCGRRRRMRPGGLGTCARQRPDPARHHAAEPAARWPCRPPSSCGPRPGASPSTRLPSPSGPTSTMTPSKCIRSACRPPSTGPGPRISGPPRCTLDRAGRRPGPAAGQRRGHQGRNLPEDQWVANLPVKHLVWLRISDYLIPGRQRREPADASGAPLLAPAAAQSLRRQRCGSAAKRGLYRSRPHQRVRRRPFRHESGGGCPRPAEGARWNCASRISSRRSRCSTAPSTSTAATNAGYLYGSGPLLNVDIVCEALFFRSNYEPMMPQIVKDMLEGKVAARSSADQGRARDRARRDRQVR